MSLEDIKMFVNSTALTKDCIPLDKLLLSSNNKIKDESKYIIDVNNDKYLPVVSSNFPVLWTTNDEGYIIDTIASNNNFVFLRESYSTTTNIKALNTKTGELLWKYLNIKDTNNLTANENFVFISKNDRTIIALNAANGTTAWVSLAQPYGAFQLACNKDFVFMSDGTNKVITAFKAATGSVAWTCATQASVPRSLVANSKYVSFTQSLDNTAKLLDANTGEMIWSTPAVGTSPNSIFINDYVLGVISNDRKEINTYNIKTKELLWTRMYSIATSTYYYAATNKLYLIMIDSASNIKVFNIMNGNLVWIFPPLSGSIYYISANSQGFFIINSSFRIVQSISTLAQINGYERVDE